MAAPGEKIFSTWPGGYNYKSGTSFAAPMVSGLASLILTINPSLSPNRVISIIKRHVDRLPALAGFVATGGRINAARALRAVAPGGGDVNAGDGGDGGSKSSCFVQSAGS